MEVEGRRYQRIENGDSVAADDDRGNHTSQESSTSFLSTLMNLLKGNVGIGVLALPFTVGQAGSIFGPVCILLLGVIITRNMALLAAADTSNYKATNKNRDVVETFTFALRNYTTESTLTWIERLMQVFLVVYIVGLTSVYIVAASELMFQAAVSLCPSILSTRFNDERVWTLLLMLCLLLLLPLSNINAIAKLSLLCNVVSFVILGAVMGYTGRRVKSPSAYDYMGRMSEMPNSINTFVFSFESISTMLNVLNKIRNRDKAATTVIVANSITTGFYIIFGWLCFLALGEQTKEQILLSMPLEYKFWNYLMIAYAVSSALTVVILVFCLMDIIRPKLVSCGPFSPWRLYSIDLAIRVGAVVIGVVIAVFTPKFSHLLGLLGALFAIPISFIMPSIIDIARSGSGPRPLTLSAKLNNVLNVSTILLGLFFAFIGAYVEIRAFIN